MENASSKVQVQTVGAPDGERAFRSHVWSLGETFQLWKKQASVCEAASRQAIAMAE